MRYEVLYRFGGYACLICAALHLGGAATAAIFGEWAQLAAFGASFVLLATFAGVLILLGADRHVRSSRPREALAAVALVWLAGPVAFSLPFLLGAPNNSVPAAILEAAAAFTTTGRPASAFPADAYPVSVLAFRMMLHLVGAILSLWTALTVLAAINLGSSGIHRTYLFTLPDGDFLSATRRAGTAAAVFTLTLATATAVALVVAGEDGGSAMLAGASAASTGLVSPTHDSLPALAAVKLILGAALFIAAAGLLPGAALARLDWKRAVRDPELYGFTILVILTALAAIVASGNAGNAVLWSVSAASTSGMLDPVLKDGSLSAPLQLIPVIIGGSALSAAGGLKIARLLILARRAEREANTLSFEGSIVQLRYRARFLSDDSVVGVWVYLVAYLCLLAGAATILALTGLPFDDAVQASVGALSNAGHLVGTESATGLVRSIIMFVLMVAGRLEVLALLPLLRPGFWR